MKIFNCTIIWPWVALFWPVAFFAQLIFAVSAHCATLTHEQLSKTFVLEEYSHLQRELFTIFEDRECSLFETKKQHELPPGLAIKCPTNMQNFYNLDTFETEIKNSSTFKSNYGTGDVKEMCHNYKKYFGSGPLPENMGGGSMFLFLSLDSSLSQEHDPLKIQALVIEFNKNNPAHKIKETTDPVLIHKELNSKIGNAQDFLESSCPEDMARHSCLMTMYGRLQKIHDYISCGGNGFLSSNADNWTMTLNKVLLHCSIKGYFPNNCPIRTFFVSEKAELGDIGDLDIHSDGELYRNGVKVALDQLPPGAISSLELCVLAEHCQLIPSPETHGAPYLVDCSF